MKTIDAQLVFDGDAAPVIEALTTLPPPLRPIHFSHGERVKSRADRVDDAERFAAFVAKSQSGFILLGPGVGYSLRIADGGGLICDCSIRLEPRLAEEFLTHMARLQPLFGYACASEERDHRNRVTKKVGVNSIESWVGRDLARYVPGLYWLTLLPEKLAAKHEVALEALERIALGHVALPGGQHLFRFYERPDDWRTSTAVTQLSASMPGVFDVAKIKPLLAAATTFDEVFAVTRLAP